MEPRVNQVAKQKIRFWLDQIDKLKRQYQDGQIMQDPRPLVYRTNILSPWYLVATCNPLAEDRITSDCGRGKDRRA